MKQGKVTMVLAVQISCPNCGGICDNEERGSSMIEEQDKIVVCEDCGERCAVPASAWKIKQSKVASGR